MNKKYYKALLKGTMTDKYTSYRYKIGEVYEMTENHKEPLICTDNLFSLPLSYKIGVYDIYEIEPLGKIVYDKEKFFHKTTSLKIVKKLSEKEINNWYNRHINKFIKNDNLYIKFGIVYIGRNEDLDILINDNDTDIKYEILSRYKREKDIDILVHDESPLIRRTIAKIGRNEDLDILVHDDHFDVLLEVAEHKRDKDLDILCNSKFVNIRKKVAEIGRNKDLDVLVHDKIYHVRKEVAKHGRYEDLDILVHDNDPHVRYEVIKHGRTEDLDILINDRNWYIRSEAQFKKMMKGQIILK